jgi:hypothetical protein
MDFLLCQGNILLYYSKKTDSMIIPLFMEIYKMLIEKHVDMNDIVTIKLSSGEEIVGKLVNRAIDSISLAKPIKISIQPVNQNQVGLAFVPFLGSVHDATIVFPFSGMVSRPVKTGEDVTRNYIQATTGIVTATAEQSGLILP